LYICLVKKSTLSSQPRPEASFAPADLSLIRRNIKKGRPI